MQIGKVFAATAIAAAAAFIPTPAQSAATSCWWKPANVNRFKGPFPCDVVSRKNYNGHIVHDLSITNRGDTAKFTLVLWFRENERPAADNDYAGTAEVIWNQQGQTFRTEHRYIVDSQGDVQIARWTDKGNIAVRLPGYHRPASRGTARRRTAPRLPGSEFYGDLF